MAVNLQAGQLCERCTASRCVDCPNEDEPLCMRLEDNREIVIAECPNRWVGESVRRIVRDADRIKNGGAMAVSGGYYEQPAAFITGIELVWAEQENLRRELKEKNGK